MFPQIQNFNMANFQHKVNLKIDLGLFKNLIMEASMLPLNFDELNTKFEKT